jgi:hypothetical protein
VTQARKFFVPSGEPMAPMVTEPSAAGGVVCPVVAEGPARPAARSAGGLHRDHLAEVLNLDPRGRRFVAVPMVAERRGLVQY